MKFKLTLFLCIAVAAILGSFLGQLAGQSLSPYISWLGFTAAFGFDTFSLDLHIIQISLGLHININMVQLLLSIIGIALAPKIAAAIKTK